MARILGLDIDRNAVRGVLLKTAFRRTELDRFVHVPLAEPPESAGRVPELHDALQNLLRAIGKPPDIVLTALDGQQASLRVIELPLGAAKRVAEVLPFELESMLPFDVIDAVVDYQPIDTKDGQLRLLAAAALRERVREHLAVFHGGPLEPREVAVGAAALDGLRTLCPEIGTGHSAVLEIGDLETNFCALSHGRAAFARTLSVGGDALPMQEQELFSGVRQTLAAYRAAGAEPLERLYLGGQGPLYELAAELARETGIEVELLTLPKTEQSQTPLPLDFTRAAALAGRALASGKRINLRSGEFAAMRGRGDMASHLNLLAVCGVLVLLAFVFSLKARQSVLADERTALTKQLADTTQRVFGKRETDAARVQTMLKSPQNDNPLPRFDAYDALGAISEAVPLEITHEVRHMRIDLAEDKKEGQLELQGGLASIDERDQIVAKLEAHGCFREIQRGRTSPGRSNDQINYQIEAKVQCPGDGAAKKRKPKSSADE
jgi:general secretion pathway protein L